MCRNVDENNLYYSASMNVLFNKDRTVLIKYLEGKISTNYVIPASVITIQESAFSNSKLEIITFTKDSNVTSIEDYTFEGSYDLAEIILPASVININDNAFRGCNLITMTVLENSATSVEFLVPESVTTIYIADSVNSNTAILRTFLKVEITDKPRYVKWIRLI